MHRFFKLSAVAIVMILLTVVIAYPGKGQDATPPRIVPGPWGDIVDPVTPPIFESEADRITFYRRQQMRAISSHFRSLEGIIEYDAPFQAQAMQHIEALNAIAQHLQQLFPLGTAANDGETGARPLIWQEPEKFAQHIQGFQNSVIALQKTLCYTTPTDASEVLTAVRHQCLACHQSYRVR